MLTIADFQADYYLPEGLSDQAAVRTRLDRVVRHRLQTELQGRLQAPSADEAAVYRIRQLRLDLWIDALSMTDGEIARHWSRLLLQTVTRALWLGSADEVVRYDDHAHFVAAFLSDLLAGQAWSRWVYSEFAPLRDLSVGQIAAHLLAPRPALLLPVSQRLHNNGQLEPLLQRLQPADVQLIWDKGLGFTDAAELPAVDSQLAQIVTILQTGVVLERGGSTAATARNTLRLYLTAVITRPTLAGNTVLATVCLHLARLQRLQTARPAPVLWAALAHKEIATPDALKPFLAGLSPALTPAGHWLAATLSTSIGRTYLSRLIPIVAPAVSSNRSPMRQKPKATSADTNDLSAGEPAASQSLATSFAGLALLLPVIRDLGLHKSLSGAGLYQLLLQVVGRAYAPLAWGDGAPALLAGVPETQTAHARSLSISWPDVASWSDADAMSRMAELVTDDLGPLPGSAVALLVLRHFAQGLRGFADSSPGYLAKQFINLPGRVFLNDATIEAHLSRAPLGIVLQMAGRDGDQGPIPWLNDRRLWIHLPTG